MPRRTLSPRISTTVTMMSLLMTIDSFFFLDNTSIAAYPSRKSPERNWGGDSHTTLTGVRAGDIPHPHPSRVKSQAGDGGFRPPMRGGQMTGGPGLQLECDLIIYHSTGGSYARQGARAVLSDHSSTFPTPPFLACAAVGDSPMTRPATKQPKPAGRNGFRPAGSSGVDRKDRFNCPSAGSG